MAKEDKANPQSISSHVAQDRAPCRGPAVLHRELEFPFHWRSKVVLFGIRSISLIEVGLYSCPHRYGGRLPSGTACLFTSGECRIYGIARHGVHLLWRRGVKLPLAAVDAGQQTFLDKVTQHRQLLQCTKARLQTHPRPLVCNANFALERPAQR